MKDKKAQVAVADAVITLIILVIASGYMYYTSSTISSEASADIHNRIMKDYADAALKTVLCMTYDINNTTMTGMDVAITIYDLKVRGMNYDSYSSLIGDACNVVVEGKNWALRIHGRNSGSEVLISGHTPPDEFYACTIDIPHGGEVVEVTMYIW